MCSRFAPKDAPTWKHILIGMHIENVFEMVTQPQAQFELAVQLEIGIHVQLPDMVQWFACVQMQGIVCETCVRIQMGPQTKTL